MQTRTTIVAVVAMLLSVGAAQAAITIETVPVGNTGNVGELSANTPVGNAPDRICGSVAYTYNIGKYEVTAGQYAAFLNAVAKTDPYGLYNPYMDSVPQGCQITRHGTAGNYAYDFSGRPSGTEADWANRPVNYVSWGDAARFANWLHNGQPTGLPSPSTTEDGAYNLKATEQYYGPYEGDPDEGVALSAEGSAALMAVTRKVDWKWAITSEDEWYKAAYYKGGSTNAGYWDYPTSSNTAPGRDIADASGNNANYYNNGYAIGSPYYRTVVGEFQNSDSPYGTFDQGGNVWEWNEASIFGDYRGLRGGSFVYSAINLYASSRNYDDPACEENFDGFRVSAVPEPATLAILALGGIGLLRKRRSAFAHC